MYPQVDKITQWFDGISEIKDKSIAEFYERKTMNETRIKYLAVFNYVGKALLVLSATYGGVSVALLANLIGASVWISLVYLFSNRMANEFIKTMTKKKKKNNKILSLARNRR